MRLPRARWTQYPVVPVLLVVVEPDPGVLEAEGEVVLDETRPDREPEREDRQRYTETTEATRSQRVDVRLIEAAVTASS